LAVRPSIHFSASQPPTRSSTIRSSRTSASTISSADWLALKANFRDDTYYAADFRWRDQVVRGIGIRSRGFGTRSATKPSLKLDFNYFSPDREFLGLKQAVLKNDLTDPSNMHDRLSMLLMRRMGIPAPREASARLFVNGDYYGVYTLIEGIDKDFLKRVFGDNDGYLFSYEWAGPYFFATAAPTVPYVPSPFSPETHEDDPEPQAIVELVQTINYSTNFASDVNTYWTSRSSSAMSRSKTSSPTATTSTATTAWRTSSLPASRPAAVRADCLDKSEAFSSPLFDIYQHVFENQLTSKALAVPELRALYLDTCSNA
jgi:hypothetical protein